jgi:hypothetical protein
MYTGKELANQMPTAAQNAQISATNFLAKWNEIKIARNP